MDMRIDELAHRASVPSRTIRYYTQQGLLPPPRLKGRVGYYSETHLERLRLIKELQEKRFLPLSVIRGVIRSCEAGVDLEAMLAPLDFVFGPPAGDRPELTRGQLAQRAGVDEAVVDAAEDMGLLFPAGSRSQARYSQDDVHMLEVAHDWLRLGLPIELGRVYRRSLEQISRMQVRAFNECVVAPLAERELSPEDARAELVRGFKDMSRTFDGLVNMLHRKLLQKAVETFAQSPESD